MSAVHTTVSEDLLCVSKPVPRLIWFSYGQYVRVRSSLSKMPQDLCSSPLWVHCIQDYDIL